MTQVLNSAGVGTRGKMKYLDKKTCPSDKPAANCLSYDSPICMAYSWTLKMEAISQKIVFSIVTTVGTLNLTWFFLAIWFL
jgi:hypothetical protein